MGCVWRRESARSVDNLWRCPTRNAKAAGYFAVAGTSVAVVVRNVTRRSHFLGERSWRSTSSSLGRCWACFITCHIGVHISRRISPLRYETCFLWICSSNQSMMNEQINHFVLWVQAGTSENTVSQYAVYQREVFAIRNRHELIQFGGFEEDGETRVEVYCDEVLWGLVFEFKIGWLYLVLF